MTPVAARRAIRTTLLLLPVLPACGRSGGPVFSVRDSSGIEIAESRRPAWSGDRPGITLSVEPVLQVGAVEGSPEYQLDEVRGVVRLGDGRVAVANGATNEIRFYGPDGRFISAAGRTGQGPGEFEGLGGLWRLPGDTLVAYDLQLRRVSRFAPTGGFLGSAMVSSPVELEYPQVIGAFDDGNLLLMTSKGVGLDPRSGTRRDSVHLFRIRADGTIRDSLGAFPSNDILVATGGTEGRSWTSVSWLPLGRRSSFAAQGDRLIVARSEAWEIEVRRPDGALRRLVRRPQAREPLPREEVDAVLDRTVAEIRGRDSAYAVQYREMMSRAEWPAYKAAHGPVLATRDGSLWVGEVEAGDTAPQRWAVLDPDGRLLGTVVTPARFRPMDIGADHVAGLWQDDQNVTWLRVYRLERAAR